jgi:hypothetical protein
MLMSIVVVSCDATMWQNQKFHDTSKLFENVVKAKVLCKKP